MAPQPRKCAFCFGDGVARRLSREHVLSRPVAEAFAIDRAHGLFGELDPEIGEPRIQPLDRLMVRAVCEQCNNGWMNDLEHDMTRIARWTHDGSALTAADEIVLKRWVLKTYVVLGALAGRTRTWLDDPESPGIPLEAPRARALYEGRLDDAFDGLYFGIARAEEERFAYSLGNPTVRPVGPRYIGRRSTGAAVITVGVLQLWVVATCQFVPDAVVGTPFYVRSVEAGLRFDDTAHSALVPDVESHVVVEYPEHDFPAFWEQVVAAVKEMEQND